MKIIWYLFSIAWAIISIKMLFLNQNASHATEMSLLTLLLAKTYEN